MRETDRELARRRFSERLAKVVGDESKEVFATRAQVSESQLRRMLASESDPTRQVMVQLAAAGNVSVSWLAEGVGPKERWRTVSELRKVLLLPSEEVGDLIEVPYLDFTKPRGEERSMATTSSTFIDMVLRVEPKGCVIVRSGRSTPGIGPVDSMLILDSEYADELRVDGEYLVDIGGNYGVYNVRRFPDHEAQFAQGKKTFVIKLKRGYPSDFRIVGKVVWRLVAGR